MRVLANKAGTKLGSTQFEKVLDCGKFCNQCHRFNFVSKNIKAGSLYNDLQLNLILT